ncbi:MAG: hypothetical protein RL263_326, partial [Bacteroidota bacterium]
ISEMKKLFGIVLLVVGIFMFVSSCKSTHRADFNPVKRKSIKACPSF